MLVDILLRVASMIDFFPSGVPEGVGSFVAAPESSGLVLGE